MQLSAAAATIVNSAVRNKRRIAAAEERTNNFVISGKKAAKEPFLRRVSSVRVRKLWPEWLCDPSAGQKARPESGWVFLVTKFKAVAVVEVDVVVAWVRLRHRSRRSWPMIFAVQCRLWKTFQPQVQERQVLRRHFVHRRRRLSFASFPTFVETKNKNCESIWFFDRRKLTHSLDELAFFMV